MAWHPFRGIRESEPLRLASWMVRWLVVRLGESEDGVGRARSSVELPPTWHPSIEAGTTDQPTTWLGRMCSSQCVLGLACEHERRVLGRACWRERSVRGSF